MKQEVQNVQLRHLLNLIKELIEQIYLDIMDSHNLLYMVETLMTFESSLYQYCQGDYIVHLNTIFFIIEKATLRFFESNLLLNILKK